MKINISIKKYKTTFFHFFLQSLLMVAGESTLAVKNKELDKNQWKQGNLFIVNIKNSKCEIKVLIFLRILFIYAH